MSWRDRTIQGVVYRLGHLDPFVLPVTPKAVGAPTFKVRVEFGAHVFTRTLHPNDTPDYHFRDRGETRCFCIDRHAYSQRLPELIRSNADKKAFFSNNRNFLFFKSLPGLSGPYAAFFNLTKARSPQYDAVMFVVSAYQKPNLPKTLPAISVPTLVAKTVAGARVRRPKK